MVKESLEINGAQFVGTEDGDPAPEAEDSTFLGGDRRVRGASSSLRFDARLVRDADGRD
jgi:hypothetical protein